MSLSTRKEVFLLKIKSFREFSYFVGVLNPMNTMDSAEFMLDPSYDIKTIAELVDKINL